MSSRFKKISLIIVYICIIILIIDVVYFFYHKNKDSKVYFDFINAFDNNSYGYVTVGSNNDNSKGLEKAKISKYNNKKVKSWEKIYNYGYNGSFLSVKMDGEYIVAVGSYESTKKEHEESIRSALFVKYDKDGNIVFDKKFQLLGDSKFTNIYVVDDGYIVVGQSIYENMTLGYSKDGGAFIIKYNKEGEIVWKKNYGGSKSGIYNNLICYNDYIYAVGKNYARVGILSKYDMDGNLITTSEYKYTDTVGFTDVSVLDGNIVVVGSKYNEDDDSTDALIVKYDLDCNHVSEVTYHDKDMNRFNKLIIDSNKNIITIGTTAKYHSKKSNDDVDTIQYDGVIAKYKDNLKMIDVEIYGDNNDVNDYFTDIKYIDSNYVVSGYSSYKREGYMSKFITYSDALKVLEVK